MYQSYLYKYKSIKPNAGGNGPVSREVIVAVHPVKIVEFTYWYCGGMRQYAYTARWITERYDEVELQYKDETMADYRTLSKEKSGESRIDLKWSMHFTVRLICKGPGGPVIKEVGQ